MFSQFRKEAKSLIERLNQGRGGDDSDFGFESENPLVPLNANNGPKTLFNKKELKEE
jgi:hypothetical protein